MPAPERAERHYRYDPTQALATWGRAVLSAYPMAFGRPTGLEVMSVDRLAREGHGRLPIDDETARYGEDVSTMKFHGVE